MREFNITDIDEILHEASYRSPKGYIDIDKFEDILLIENTMYEMDYFPDTITELINILTEARPAHHPTLTYVLTNTGINKFKQMGITFSDDIEFNPATSPIFPAYLMGSTIFKKIEKSQLKSYKNGEYLYWNANDDSISLILPKNSHTPINTVKQKLKEGDIAAEDYEPIICIAYNMKHLKVGPNKAMEIAGIKGAEANKLRKIIEKNDIVIKSFIKNLKYMGNQLVHTGRTKSTTEISDIWKKYGATDLTPKTDIYGGKNNRISLKKYGGSQLMSGKSGETKSTFEAARKWYADKDRKNAMRASAKIIKRIDELFGEIKSETKTVEDLKKELKNNYFNYRWKELINSKYIEKYGVTKVKNHIDAEFYKIQHNRNSNKLLPDIEFDTSGKKFFSHFKTDKNIKKEIKSQILDVYATIINHKIIQDEINGIFLDKEFKKWVVYEAATGAYKFTGTTDKLANETSEVAVSNKMLHFTQQGKTSLSNLTPEWARKYTDQVKVTVYFKSSGKTKYSSMRLTTNENYNVNEIYTIEENFVESIIDNELKILDENIDNILMLDEGLIDTLTDLKNKFAGFIENFYENIIKKIYDRLKQYAIKGFNYLLIMLGIEVDGEAFADVEF